MHQELCQRGGTPADSNHQRGHMPVQHIVEGVLQEQLQAALHTAGAHHRALCGSSSTTGTRSGGSQVRRRVS
jgi:hypothetical protein